MTTPSDRRIFVDVHTAEALLTAVSDAQTFWTEWREQPDFADHYTDDDVASAIRRQVEQDTARDVLQAALDEHRRAEASLTAPSLSPSPYDTGARLQPTVWPTDGDPDRYGRVDLDTDEGATVVTVHVESTSEGYDLVVADHTGALTVHLDGHPMTPSPVTTNVDVPVSWTGSGHDGPGL